MFARPPPPMFEMDQALLCLPARVRNLPSAAGRTVVDS